MAIDEHAQGPVSTEKIVARRYEPDRDRAKAQMWFRQMFSEWKDRSGFNDQLLTCCPERSASLWSLDDYLKRLQALYILEDNGRIIGSTALEAVPGRPDAVSFHDLSIEPEYQGTAVGAMMFAVGFKELAEGNVRRLVGETWASNVEATKLYRTIGNFWVPNTEIEFENFLLTLYRHPESVGFRERHGLDIEQWLRSFVLAALRTRGADLRRHAPDVYEYRGMNIFPHVWEEQGEVLLFRVGADSREVISVGTPAAGVDCYIRPGTSTLTCEVLNKTDTELPMTITFLKGATFQDWQARYAEATASVQSTLDPGSTLTRNFVLKPTADTRHALTTVMTVGEAIFPFFAEF